MMRVARKEKGFTLIEILIVVIIVGILVGMAIPQISTIRKTTWTNTCRSNRSTLESLAEVYYNNHNSAYPTSGLESGLKGDSLLKKDVYCPSVGTDTYSINASGTVTCSKQTTGGDNTHGD